MQIEESKLIVIAKAVVDNIVVEGTYGANVFTTQEMLQDGVLSLDTIEKMHSKISEQIEKAPKRLLSERKEKSAHTLLLERKVELLEVIYNIRANREEEAKINRKKRQDAAAKLAVMRGIQNRKEIEAMEAWSEEELAKQIADAEALTEA